MIQFLKDLLTSNNKLSSLRAMSFIALLTACGLASYGLYVQVDLMGLTALCSAFLAAAFGGKVAQKQIENKENNEKP